MTKTFHVSKYSAIRPCPECGNVKEFTAHSEQVAEDMCEVWVSCKCGHAPGERIESVMGEIDKDTISNALSCWNEAVKG